MHLNQTIAVIGAGAIGSSTAWHLASLGHEVMLIDPSLNKPISRSNSPLSGTNASLGVLMGYVFRRFSGRSWQLRQESMALWPDWISKLKSSEQPLTLEQPLIQLASSEAEACFMKKLTEKRANFGLELLAPIPTDKKYLDWPKTNYGGLISHKDGRIDTQKLQACLRVALRKSNVVFVDKKVSHIERTSSRTSSRWCIHLENGQNIKQNTIVICTAYGSRELLNCIGYKLPLSNVLGQVLDLEIEHNQNNWKEWPAVLISHGVNLIPNGPKRILLGATLEEGKKPNKLSLKEMRDLHGSAPNWLKKAIIKNTWYGFRSKPLGQPAPILKTLEPGLIICTGHYRNGILLAPASAIRVGEMIS